MTTEPSTPRSSAATPRLPDPECSRRGRTNRARGNAHEREWCKRLGFRRGGHYGGPEDGIARNGMFVGQAKSLSTARFPSWLSRELAKLPRSEGRIPVLGILEALGEAWEELKDQGDERRRLASALFDSLDVEGFQTLRPVLRTAAVAHGFAEVLPEQFTIPARGIVGNGRGERI